MIENDITILDEVMAITGQKGRVYYYQGNIYQPLYLHGGEVGRIRKAVREFMKDNRVMVDKDRSDPDYKTIIEIFDEQMEKAHV